MPQLKVKIDNIPYLHNDDLLNKLKCAQHPKINDTEAIILVKEEIERRKKEDTWMEDCVTN